jgi:insecticidal toxin complex protein TccC
MNKDKNKNGEWWNGGWQRRGKSEWDGGTVSNFREDDRGSVTLNEPPKGYWVDGLPDDPKKTARPLIKEGKNLAIEQLTLARNFLCDAKNNGAASVISHVFFGVSDMDCFRERWLAGIDKVLEGLKNLDTKRHVNYFHKKSKSTTAAEIDVNVFDSKSGAYINAYANTLLEIDGNPSLGRDHLAHVLIHEMSHACLKTNDYSYIGVLSDEGSHDLTKMVGLLNPKACSDETDKMRLARGKREAWNNADSFTTATRYLAYSAQQPEFINHVRQEKEGFTQGAKLLIKSPHWLNSGVEGGGRRLLCF